MPDFTKRCVAHGITTASDGLLRDFIGRKKYTAALDALNAAIHKRHTDLVFLEELRVDLCMELDNLNQEGEI